MQAEIRRNVSVDRFTLIKTNRQSPKFISRKCPIILRRVIIRLRETRIIQIGP